jgi:hypothetical protein
MVGRLPSTFPLDPTLLATAVSHQVGHGRS